MEGTLKNKNLVVMGVANKWSIAWAIAQKLISNEGNVIFTYYGDKSKSSLEKLLDEEGIKNAELISCDVTSDEDIEIAFKQIGDKYKVIHGVVHSIAHALRDDLKGRYIDTSRAGFGLAHDISVFSLVKSTKEAAKYMSEGGSVVTMTYLGGEKVVENYNVMGVAKASLDASVRYLAADLGPDNIRVNGVSAGPIKTLAAKGISGFNRIVDIYEQRSPLGRMVKTEEVANATFFLISNLSSGITGETLHVDCGYNIIAY